MFLLRTPASVDRPYKYLITLNIFLFVYFHVRPCMHVHSWKPEESLFQELGPEDQVQLSHLVT